MLSLIPSLLLLAFSLAKATTTPRALFKVFVYHEGALQSSGYANNDNLGCGVFRDATKASELIDFVTDPTNRVGLLALDVQPLMKSSAQPTYLPHTTQSSQVAPWPASVSNSWRAMQSLVTAVKRTAPNLALRSLPPQTTAAHQATWTRFMPRRTS